MRFHLDSDQTAIQDALRGTLTDSWSMERLHEFAETGEDFDRPSWDAMMGLGLAGILAPDSGMGLLEAALVCEIAGEAAAAGPLIGQMLAVAAVSACGNDAAKAHLDGLIEGSTIAALALDGELVVGASAADLLLTDDGAGGLRLVETATGVEVSKVASTDRSRPVSRVAIGADAISHTLAVKDDELNTRIRDAALVLIAADSLGGALKVTEMSVSYAKERDQFGQPIGRFQALKHQLAHMALDSEPARAQLWYAAYAWDAQLSDAPRAAVMAKAHLCEVYTRSTRAAVAAHGGIGYTWEYGLNYWFRRSIANRVWMGSPQELRARAADLAGW